ncbi:MAG: pseudoazurin [Pikeienuella sp.]
MQGAALAGTALLIGGGARAADGAVTEVKMLNKGEAGTMVFEPDFLRLQPGDSVRFVVVDRGHNAESMKDMTPEGAETFKGKINEEIEVSFDVEGVYGIKCLPHFAMGMVMTIAVGAATTTPEEFLKGRIPPKARQRFEAQLAQL